MVAAIANVAGRTAAAVGSDEVVARSTYARVGLALVYFLLTVGPAVADLAPAVVPVNAVVTHAAVLARVRGTLLEVSLAIGTDVTSDADALVVIYAIDASGAVLAR